MYGQQALLIRSFAHRSLLSPMLFKLFRKLSAPRPRIAQDAELAAALARRIDAIDFKPSKGFLKDQQQPRRSRRARPT